MSWDAYITQSLVGTGHVDKAAIYGLGGGAPWAASPGFEGTEEERKVIIAALDQDPNQRATGFWVGGKKNEEDTANKYISIRTPDEKYICARHAKDPTGKDETKGKEGLVATKTGQALIIAHHPAGTQTEDCYDAVYNLANYLIGVGY